MERYSLISIDPGLVTTGYALWTKNGKFASGNIIQPKKELPYITKIQYIYNELFKVYRIFLPDAMVIEFPEHWSGSVGLASRESGSIYKLVHLVGYIQGAFQHQQFLKIIFIKPREWKGQLSKDIVKERLINSTLFKNQNFSFDSLKHDLVDAIGIGYVYLGHKL